MNDTVIVSDPTNGVVKGLVVKVASARIDFTSYTAAAVTGTTTGSATTIMVYGSEFIKGKSYTQADGCRCY